MGPSKVKVQHALLLASADARIWGKALCLPKWQWEWLSGADSLAKWALLSSLYLGCGFATFEKCS